MPNPTGTCTECGHPAKRLTCSAVCAKERKRRRNREIYRKQVANGEVIRGHHHEKTCQLCGETFMARASARFCSHTCRDLNNLATGQLGRAGKKAQAAHRIDPLESIKIRGACEIRYGTCPDCGRGWLGDARTPRRYCTKACARRAYERAQYALHGDRKGHRKHKAIVFERDGYTCWLCGTPTSRVFKHDDPLSPTLDHLTPRSQGGTDEVDNLGTAHWICNSLRGAMEMTATPKPCLPL